MQQNRSNILKTFEGQKIDESVHVARWATTINNQDSSRLMFNKYASGSYNSIPNNTSDILRTENLINTQESQVHQIDTGFKKLKNNQIQMLKQLKQQYEVLRTLNVQSQLNAKANLQANNINGKNNNIHSSSNSSVHHHLNDDSEIVSSSSRPSRRGGKKSTVINNLNNLNQNNRDYQILVLQKKQLEMVINNSMRKIQELLHSEMEYKKQIHQLKIQISGKQNTTLQYQSILKTFKKNQISTAETIESLKNDNQKFRQQVRHLNDKIISLEGQVFTKQQQIRKIFDDKRKTQDLLRNQKDRYFNLQINCKQIKMELDLMEKDKNSEINRLNKQLEFKDTNKMRELQNQLKRYEQDIQLKEKRYHLLLDQLQEQKKKTIHQQKELKQLKNIQQCQVLDKEHIEQLLTNFRDQSDNTYFNKNINQVIQKLHELDQNQNQYLKQEIQELKQEIQELKQINESQGNANVEFYQQKIQQMEKVIYLLYFLQSLKQQINEKQGLMSQMRRIKYSYEDIQKKMNQYQTQVQQFEALQAKLRDQLRITRRKSTQIQFKELINSKHIQQQQYQIQHHQQQTVSVTPDINSQQKITNIEEQLRIANRRAEQNDFKATKAQNELVYRLKMQENEHNLILSRITEDIERSKRQYQYLKDEYEKYRVNIEKKLAEKDSEIQRMTLKIRQTSEYQGTNSNAVKAEYENLLKNERQKYRLQLEELTNKITNLTKINEKYMLQSNKYLHYENELMQLRQIMRKSIHLSSGIDHLWKIKEAEYQNLDQILRRISNTWQKRII